MAQMNFDANNHEPAGSFVIYDSGIYTVMINGSEFKETKAKKAGQASVGSFLQLNLRIADGPHAGGMLIDRINWENENPDAVSIGQGQLSAICRVVGVMQLQDSQQLHGIPFKVEVAKVPRNDDPSKFSNEIKGYLDMNGNDAANAGKPAADNGAAQSGNNWGAQAQADTPPAPTPPADPAPMTRPTDPAHIHEAGTPNEMWWDGTEWIKPPVATEPPAPSAPPAPTPPPATEPPQDDAPATPPWAQKAG